MVVVENEGTCNTVSDLMDFSTNICNIKHYFKAGLYEQLTKYTNISAPVLEIILLKSKNLRSFFQNTQIIHHLINNCNDLDQSCRLFEYLCMHDIDTDTILLFINAGLPVLINKILEHRLISIIYIEREKAIENNFVIYILQNYDYLYELKYVISCAYLYSDLRLVNALSDRKCEIILHDRFKIKNKRDSELYLKKPNFQENMLHFALNIKHATNQNLESNEIDWILLLGWYCPLPVIKIMVEKGYNFTDQKILQSIIIHRRYDDEILLYLLSKCLSNNDYWIIRVVIRCSSFTVIEYLFNNFNKIEVLEAILLNDRFASSMQTSNKLKTKWSSRHFLGYDVVIDYDDTMRLDNNKIIIERMIWKCNDQEFCDLLELVLFHIEEVFVFSLLVASLVERENITKVHLKTIFDRMCNKHKHYVTNKHKNMMQSCINSLDAGRVKPIDDSNNWCILV